MPAKKPAKPPKSPKKKRGRITKAAKTAAAAAAAAKELPPAEEDPVQVEAQAQVVIAEVHAHTSPASSRPTSRRGSPDTMDQERPITPPALEEGETMDVRDAPRPPSPQESIQEEPARTTRVTRVKSKSTVKSVAVDKGKKKGKGPDKNKKDWSLAAAQEEELVEWMAENDFTWRRGAMGFKGRQEAWEQKAKSLGVTGAYLMHWWKGIKDHYVKLNKLKSGQAAKKHTDREKWIITNLQFYKGKFTLII